MKKGDRVRIFSVTRLAISIVLGFLLPLSYAILLSQTQNVTGNFPPDFMATPIAWPRSLWIFLTRQQTSDENLTAGLIFLAICNIALYGAILYAALLAIAVVRRKREVFEPPPMPEQFGSDSA